MGSRYLPKTKISFKSFKKRFSYRLFKRAITKIAFDHFNESSKFVSLEIGCGAGDLANSLEKWFAQAVLVSGDYDLRHIQFASKHCKRTSFLKFDGHYLPFKPGTFDIIISLQVIEHLTSPEKMINECNRLLRPERGHLIISTPNPQGIPARVLKSRWQGASDDHVSLMPPDAWRTIFEASGFKIVQDGTTGLTGFKTLRIFPLALLNYIPMAIWGFFPWSYGESYMAILKKAQ